MQKLIGTVLCCLLLISAHTALAYEKEIKALSATMVEKVAKSGKKNVAVVDFMDLQGNTTELGRFLAEEISAELVDNAKGFEIVDRANLRSILTEHKFSMSGLVDPKTVKALGKIAGVDAIVTGTVTPFGDSVRVSAKIIATDTAKVIASAKTDIAKTKAIEELLSKGIDTSSTTIGGSVLKPAQKGQMQVEAENFQFQLYKCMSSGQIVTCDFMVTNKAADRGLNIYGTNGNNSSRIIDDMGNVFNASKVKIGTNTGNYDCGVNLASNIPMKMQLIFEGVTSQSNTLSLLELKGYSGFVAHFKAQFRNVQLATN